MPTRSNEAEPAAQGVAHAVQRLQADPALQVFNLALLDKQALE
jgi:hypothetical protein